MSFGKFTVEQIIKNNTCGLFCFEIKSRSEYDKIKQKAIKVDSELVRKWDVSVNKCRFPVYLNKAGQAISKLYAIQRDYYIVGFEDIEFGFPNDINTYICTELDKLQDDKKEQVVELVKKLVEEEKSDWYWYLDSCGRIDACKASSDISAMQDRKKIGNYFSTKEAAEFEYHRRLAVVKWKDIHDKVEHGHIFRSMVYYPSYNKLTKTLVIDSSSKLTYGGLAFSSAETCRSAIEKLGYEKVVDYILEVQR